jgi:hypothetical protein
MIENFLKIELSQQNHEHTKDITKIMQFHKTVKIIVS